MPPTLGTVLTGATLPGGEVADVRLLGPAIAEVGRSLAGAQIVDLTGYALLAAPAEPHAHLDKALLADRVPNPVGDLAGAIAGMQATAGSRTHADTADRARRAALLLLAHGATAIRTHVDVGLTVGLTGVEALLEVRAELAPYLDLQLAALMSYPLTGRAGASMRALLRDALAAGVDVVGACPHLDPDPAGTIDVCLDVAADAGRPVDLHTDETLNADMLTLPLLAERAAGFPYGVTASHCVSLGMQPAARQAEVAAQLAAAGIAVVALPQTNLFLQARGLPTAPPRGLTAVRALLDGGVTVAAGGDNLRDPFNTVGRGDPLEAASLLVAAGHLTPAEAYAAVSAGARAALGLPAVTIAPGAPAELMAVRATSADDAVGGADQDRMVWHAGRLVAQTRVDRRAGPDLRL